MQTRRIEVFYDHGCPLCRREIRLLKRWDRNGNIQATNIDDAAFKAPGSLTLNDLMERIHGRLPSGEIIEGVEVFRRLYAAVGFGWAIPLSRMPGIRHCLDAAYIVFARYRYARRTRCASGACALPPRGRAEDVSG